MDKKPDQPTVDEILNSLKVDPKSGLDRQEVKLRQEKYGLNSLQEKKIHPWLKFLSFFWGPIPWMIEIAIVLSAILERWPDLIVIGSLLLINAILGFIQEHKADNAIAALKQKLALKARVLRDKQWVDIEASELVPGDIIQVALGNIIPADIKLISGSYLSVDQSSLTGESLPVNKAVGDVAYSGTIAKLGEMQGVVTDTGMNTFFGKTAKLVESAQTKSHLQRAIMTIGNFLIITTFTIAAIILVVSLFRIHVFHTEHDSLGDIVIFLLVLVIAGIPVALPAVLSVTMAIGANQMAKLKAIVSKLMAIEELAGMDVLCSDKTGTLTKNTISVSEVKTTENVSDEELLLSAALASSATGNDPIDQAIFDYFQNKQLLSQFEQIKFTPFDPTSKRTEAEIKKDGSSFTVTKGAAQVILDLTKSSNDQYNKIIEGYASRGMRVLAIAKSDHRAYKLLGFIALLDPLRDDSKETITTAQSMGINVRMVTGDHVDIAKEIAQELNLGTNILSAQELFEKEMTSYDRDEKIEAAEGFAQVFPEHKFEIVKCLERTKHTVGMTGDGVNDAPALKQADIGIAVSNATDAARAAADLILTKPGLSVIINAIEESRRVFGRMKSYATYRISETCRLLFFLLLSMLFFNDHPLSAIMIILIALLNDIPIMMIAYDHMRIQEKPTSWKMGEIFTIAIGLAVVGVVSTFGLYWIGDRIWHLPTEQTHTLAFMALLCGGNLTIYLTRNEGLLLSKPLPEWKFFLATLFSQFVGTGISVFGLGIKDFVGIGWKYVGLSWIYIAVWFGICLLTKMLLYAILSPIRHKKDKTQESLHSHTPP